MKIVYYILMSLFFFSCKSSKLLGHKKKDYFIAKIHEGVFYTYFKNEVFIRSLKLLYPKEFRVLYDSIDGSAIANSDWLMISYNEISKTIDSVATAFTKRPEAKWELEFKKITLNACMDYRHSRELDSIARALYKKYRVKKWIKDEF